MAGCGRERRALERLIFDLQRGATAENACATGRVLYGYAVDGIRTEFNGINTLTTRRGKTVPMTIGRFKPTVLARPLDAACASHAVL